MARRHMVWACMTAGEKQLLNALAAKEQITMSDFLRRCINRYLLDLGDEMALLEETEWPRRTLTQAR